MNDPFNPANNGTDAVAGSTTIDLGPSESPTPAGATDHRDFIHDVTQASLQAAVH